MNKMRQQGITFDADGQPVYMPGYGGTQIGADGKITQMQRPNVQPLHPLQSPQPSANPAQPAQRAVPQGFDANELYSEIQANRAAVDAQMAREEEARKLRETPLIQHDPVEQMFINKFRNY